MVEVRNTLWFENTLKCGLYPIHSAKNTFNSYIIKTSIKTNIYMSSNTQLSTRAPHHAIIIRTPFRGEYNYPVHFNRAIS